MSGFDLLLFSLTSHNHISGNRNTVHLGLNSTGILPSMPQLNIPDHNVTIRSLLVQMSGEKQNKKGNNTECKIKKKSLSWFILTSSSLHYEGKMYNMSPGTHQMTECSFSSSFMSTGLCEILKSFFQLRPFYSLWFHLLCRQPFNAKCIISFEL